MKYEVKYHADGAYITVDDEDICIGLFSSFIKELIHDPIKTYVIIDEDKLKEYLKGVKNEHNE